MNGETKKNDLIGHIFVHVFANKRLFVNRVAELYITKNKMYVNSKNKKCNFLNN